MQIKIKKPSELDRVIQIKDVHVGLQNGLACYCPDCGLEHEWLDDWPIDIRIHCVDADCKCIFTIPNNVEIVE